MSDYQSPYLSEAAVSLDRQRHELQQEVDRMKEKLRYAEGLFQVAEKYTAHHPPSSISGHRHRASRYRAALLKALEALR